VKYFLVVTVNNFEDIYVRSLKVNIINGDQVTQVVPAFVYFAKALQKIQAESQYLKRHFLKDGYLKCFLGVVPTTLF
jgi:hypothetical protein